MPTWREQPCTDCGKPYLRRVRGGRKVLCDDCAAEHTATQARQMAAKSGPQYEAWVRRTAEVATRRAAELDAATARHPASSDSGQS